MGKKCKKKVQWRPLSLDEPQKENAEDKRFEYDYSRSRSTSPYKEGNREHYQSSRGHHRNVRGHFRRQQQQHFPYYDKRQHQDLQQQSWRAYDNRPPHPYDNRPPPPPYNIYDNNRVPYDNNFYGDHGPGGPFYYNHPKYYHRGPPHGFIDGSGRGRGRPFRPYPGRGGGFFAKGYRQEVAPVQHEGSEGPEEVEEEWTEQEEEQSNCDSSEQDSTERPSQPVRTVLINNEEYTKIQTPRQEVMFKKSSLDRKRDSIDQSSVTESMSESGSGMSCGEGGSGQGDQVSIAGSTEDGNIDIGQEDDNNCDIQQDAIYDDPSEMFTGDPGQPPLAGVVMQQAFPGGPMVSIPVHWTPFIDPSFIPGETALTPLDPAFTHVLDSSDLPIDPIHIMPMQHDTQGCPVQVQVKVDSNGQPIQIEPSAFTVSLSSLHSHSLDPSLHDTSLLHDHAAMQEQDQLYMEQLVQDTEQQLIKDKNKDQTHMKEEDHHEKDTQTSTQKSTDTQTAVTLDHIQHDNEKTKDVQVNECVIDNVQLSDSSDINEKSESDTIHSENSVPCLDLSKALAIPAVVPASNEGAEETVSQMEQEEEEEDEDMNTKDAEEGSDSNDSQYASMSESGSTPHSPAGEPCEASEDASDPDEVAIAPSTIDSDDPQSENSNTDKDHANHSEDQCEENQLKTLNGYVMVPILTPYYDPSVLYGYQMVVDSSHQQVTVPQPPPQPQPLHQNRYGKRKKKKNQRRRHADVPSAGGYLDPQLYTGEPFVAAPAGGYVVPYDPSLCHVHGIPYLPHQIQSQISQDEGFSSLQHSPYLPETATEPNQPHGIHHLNDDAIKNAVFGDLKEREKRQIQEVLHEINKVGKSESVESSDSGVSESEETAPSEASLVKSRERNILQSSKHSESNPEIHCCSTEVGKMLPHTENSTSILEDTINNAENCISSEEESESKRENSVLKDCPPHNYSCQKSEEDMPLISISDNATEVSQDRNDRVDIEKNLNLDSVTLETNYSKEIQEKVNEYPISCEKANVTLECVSDKIDSHNVPNSQKTSENRIENINHNNMSNLSYENLISLGASSLESDLNEKILIDCSVLSESLSANLDSKQALSDIEDSIINSNKEISSINSEESLTETEIISSIAKDYSQPPNNDSSIQNEKVQPVEAELKKIESVIVETDIEMKENIDIQDTGGTIESSIDLENLKDLKVTEAVTRWIREVSPEKAFTLSEEVQEFLMSQQEYSDDEYIEDEIEEDAKSINLMDPKNVRSNPFVAASNKPLIEVIESCSKRVASVTNEIVDEYDGASTISNLSHGRLYSESSLSFPPSINQSFDEVDDDEAKEGSEQPEIYNPNIYTKYYQLGVDMDDTTPVATPGRTRENSPQSQYTSEETLFDKLNESDYSATSPLPLAKEELKAELLSNIRANTGVTDEAAHDALCLNSPDLYIKHYGASLRELGDSGVQSEESSDEIEAHIKSGVSSGIGSSLASTPALSPLHYTPNNSTTTPHRSHNTKSKHPLSHHPLRNLSAGDGPVPLRTICCSLM